jgi:hypothetical protein
MIARWNIMRRQGFSQGLSIPIPPPPVAKPFQRQIGRGSNADKTLAIKSGAESGVIIGASGAGQRATVGVLTALEAGRLCS